jgi:hypothetical protein
MCNAHRRHNSLYRINEEQDLSEDYGFFYILDDDARHLAKPTFIIRDESLRQIFEDQIQVRSAEEPATLLYCLIYNVFNWIFGSR